MAREVTLNPRFGKRSWVKLWVNEWLDGTTRFEMSDAQRAFWVDLLAMAGRSRFPGIICAGQINGRFIGYPINKFQSLMSEPIDVEQTFELFASNGKISIEITAESPTKLYKIELCNWTRFQSEYQRQKPYRLQKGDAESYAPSNKTEVEVEVEVDGEVEAERKNRAKVNHAPPDERLNVESVKAQIEARRESLHDRESAAERRRRRNQEAIDAAG